MNTSDDLRAHLEAEYQKAVQQASLPPDEERALLEPDAVAGLSDDDLRGFIRTHTRMQSALFSGDKEEERTWFDKYLRYVVSASAPVGAFIFLYFAALYDKEAHRILEHSAIKKTETPDELLIMSGRVTWGVSHALFYAAVCATTYFGLCYIIPTALKRRPIRVRVWAVIATLTFAGAIGLSSGHFQNHLEIPRTLLEVTVNENWPLPTECFPFYEIKPLIQCKMETAERWLYFTHAFLLALCIIIVYAVARDSQDVTQLKCSFDQMERRLRINMKLLRLVLYLGAAVLVTEIVSVGALLHWPLTYLPESPGRSADRLISALITERAINYTLFLALLYVPSFLLFREDAYRFARLRCPDKSLAEQERWLREQGIGVSTWRYLPRVVAIMGPLLSQQILEWMRHILG